jgi:Ca-activated chloride channel family protein
MKSNDSQSKRLIPAAALLVLAASVLPIGTQLKANQGAANAGTLMAVDRAGKAFAVCPLQRTEVRAEITGFLSRVTVTQNFENPLKEKIEAVYTFPLPQNGAVDDMTMHVGDRVIKGKIKPREEARAIYEAARNAGRTASMLEQERPNIFSQSVANINPGEKVKIVISYVETLKYEAGSYEFVFPMVVGPRYIPGKQAIGRQGSGWSPDTKQVPDASRITPPVAIPGTRAGHDITVEVTLDAGVPIDALETKTHETLIARPDPRKAVIKLKEQATIPNKDFILRYDVAGKKIEDAVLAHRAARGGFFTLILQPPERVNPSEVTPKEIVFVLDTSGSMSGFPLDKSKELMRTALANLNPQDTFNIISFAGDTHILFPDPVPATAANVQSAQQFMEGRRGGGGTEMMKAIRAALAPTASLKHVRVVAFLTDGYVGNDMEIIAEIKKHSNARVFSFGIGNSVNRFLLDSMAEQGRGEVEYVTLKDDGSAAARRFYERMRNPLMTDITVDWGGLPITDVYPKRFPDLFSAKPLIIQGRYTGPARGAVRLSGKVAGNAVTRSVAVDLPANEPRHDTLAALWARAKISDLMAQDFGGIQRGTVSDNLRNEITKLGLEFRLMTQYTAFVAVEEKEVIESGKPRRIEVPVEMPEGVSYEVVFGDRLSAQNRVMQFAQIQGRQSPGIAGGVAETTALPSAPPRKIRPKEADYRTEPVQVSASSKLDPELAELLSQIKQGKLTSRLIVDGKIALKVYVTSNDAAAIKSLRDAGFEVAGHDRAAMTVTGRIAAARLEALTKLAAVRFLAADHGTL